MCTAFQGDPQNFSLLDRIALNLLKQERSCKLGMHG
jgi:hypothetical protein